MSSCDYDCYEDVIQALYDGDIAFLERYAKSHTDFPHGNDAFIGRRWLTNAVGYGTLEVVQWFLDQGVDVNYKDDEGFSPLKSSMGRNETAVILNRAKDASVVISMLLKAGAEVNALGTLDETPLHFATALGMVDVVEQLLKAGADPLIQDSDYWYETPLDIAKRRKFDEIVALIKEHIKSTARSGNQ